jgi:hypothetical protein
VVKLTDRRLVADFKLTLQEAAELKPGSTVAVGVEGARAPVNTRVLGINGSVVRIDLSGSPFKIGDSVQLVRARTPNLIREPLGAVMAGPAGDQVLVLEEGVVHARPVTVVERTPTEAYIRQGLRTGEAVVQSGLEKLKDGQRAKGD